MTKQDALENLVSAFGADAKKKLSGPGQAEANLRKPLEVLLESAAEELLGYEATFFDEVSEFDLGVRPDYAFEIDGAITGYVEVKKPGHNLEPSSFRDHDKKQWERQKDLPNLVYTNGTEFRLYRDGELRLDPVILSGSLSESGSALQAPEEFEVLLRELFTWKPAPIRTISKVVASIAPLTRLLRESVLEQLRIEQQPGRQDEAKPFTGLASDWRGLLFPDASDEVFADGYAQTVSFALLLAQIEGIELESRSLHEIGSDLGHTHSLMGKALQLLTDDLAGDFRVTLDLLVRVIGAVEWDKIEESPKDEFLHLYEKFLSVYDPELRKESGSYYTPVEVVNEMVRLCEEVLTEHLGIPNGFGDDRVWTIDPAMGTGTYLQSVIERVADQAEANDGPGAVSEALSSLGERLAGFEIQTGPFSVAELRVSQLFKNAGAKHPSGGLKLYVTDTLADPYAEEQALASNLKPISSSRSAASRIKREENVTVVVGNPPYRKEAEGEGGWVESGSTMGGERGTQGETPTIPLDSFRYPGNGVLEYHLKSLYVYFWRWATWKVFDSIPTESSGVVCLITTMGYLRGRAFAGMRKYLRETCSEGWIINLTPEGLKRPANTSIFPTVRQPVAIGLFVRSEASERTEPAPIHYRDIWGTREEKFVELKEVELSDDGWRDARTDWTAPFTPAAETDWDTFPELTDLFLWVNPGVKPNKTWVYSPSPEVLEERWASLVGEDDLAVKGAKFRESRDSNLEKTKEPLPGYPAHAGAFIREAGDCPTPVRVLYRGFDRQWIIPDSRLISQPRPPLWAARIPEQIFVLEQHTKALSTGPGLLFSNLIPDDSAFYTPDGGGGRVIPFLQPDGSANLVQGLCDALNGVLGVEINATDVLSYIAGVVANPAFVETFSDELEQTPGIRVPVTGDPDLFDRAIELGRRVIWLHSLGEADAFAPPGEEFEFDKGDERRPKVQTAMQALPDGEVDYNAATNILSIGTATFSPVRPEVADYEVAGRNVIHYWLSFRCENPAGKRSSPLNDIVATEWSSEWTQEFLTVLTALTKLVEQEEDQAEVLAAILAGRLLSTEELLSRGVQAPGTDDRKPNVPPPPDDELFQPLGPE